MSSLLLALIVFQLVVMVLSISVHDCAQAWAANKLGDPTARMLGRITMNPAAHFDLFGTAIAPLLNIFIFHSSLPYGWGKQVPMTYRNFVKKNGEMLAIAAGPAAQFLVAVVALLILVVLKHTSPAARESLIFVLAVARHVPVEGLSSLPGIFPLLLFLYLSIMQSLLLFCFNLLPLPFLDGGKVLAYFLPYNAARAFEQYSMYLVLAFFLVGGFLVNIVFIPLLSIFLGLLGSL
jgi:Zn-dependent protease